MVLLMDAREFVVGCGGVFAFTFCLPLLVGLRGGFC